MSRQIWFVSLVFFLLMALNACQGENAQKATSDDSGAELRELEREVMKIHDDVMPKMSNMSSLRSRLGSIADSAGTDQNIREKISGATLALKEADSLMWEWMYAYNRPEEDAHPDSVRAYLQSEKQKIEVVRNRMLESIERAEQLLNELSTDEN